MSPQEFIQAHQGPSPGLYDLGTLGIKSPPGLVEHLEVPVTNLLLFVHVNYFQEDSDVHDDDQQEAQDHVGAEEDFT